MRTRVLVAVVVAATIATGAVPVTASDTTTRWDSFSESSSCGDPYTRTPFMSRKGSLPSAEPILGPFGAYFGRTIDEVRTRLVDWTVPNSGGIRVRVHQAMLPSLQKVAANLAAEAAIGRTYRVTVAHGFVPRTIGGSYQLSRHGLGLAIDINPAQNPHQLDGVLIADMPTWFVDAWRSAGFCWGGDWRGAKDPMHFSWMGPGALGSVSLPLLPSAPVTGLSAFRSPAASHVTPFAPVMTRYVFGIHDGTGNSVPDVVGVRPHLDGAVIDISTSTGGFGTCSISRWYVPDASVLEAQHLIFGDVDGDSGQDLIALSTLGGALNATIATRRSEFEDIVTRPTAAASSSIAFAAADFDGDRLADLWEATADGVLRIWRGSGWTELITESSLPAGPPVRLSVGDRDGGDTPELYALYPDRVEVLRWTASWMIDDTVPTGSGGIVSVGAGDYDGDGRADLQLFDASGTMTVFLGNTPTGLASSGWFVHPEWECDDRDVKLVYQGTFFDDDTNQFQHEIEAIAAAGITLGCNPPFVDRFCPNLVVSRSQIAAFLVRGLGLTANTHPGFVDVAPGSPFHEEIGRLASAGITKGCTAAGDQFCPDLAVTRDEMAAFLTRALGLSDNTHPGFFDVPPGHHLREEIGRIATAGITRGCIPTGDQFCPDLPVTRGEMAAFLHRAGATDRP